MHSPTAQSLHQSAQTLLRAGKPQLAVAALEEIVQLFPREPKAPFMLGVLAHQAGKSAVAREWLDKSIAIDPSEPESYFVRGMIHHQSQRLKEAVADYRMCLARRPTDSRALNNIGRVLLDMGDITEANRFLLQAVTAAPKNGGAWNNLGEARRAAGDLDGAIVHYRKAVEVDPNCAEAHGNLGASLVQKGEKLAGIAEMRTALSLNAKLVNAHVNLARAFISGGPLDEAERHCRLALQLQPNSASALDLFANLLGLAGLVQQSIAARKQALAFKPGDSSIHSNLLMTLHYVDGLPNQAIFDAHLDWGNRHASGKAAPVEEFRMPSQHRRLRVGYVSPNFNAHSVSYFFEPVLRAHDSAVVEIFCYSNLRGGDDTTARIRSLSEHWREIAGRSVDDLVAMIRQDQIDVLVDLAGHTSDNKLPVFARKPAPVQMSWLGYPATTGMTAMDYRVTDGIADLPNLAEEIHVEKLIRVPGGCWAYQAPASPVVAAPPALMNGCVTFGSFNNLPKVTPRVLETWANVLRRVPRSRLLLKAAGLGAAMGRQYVTDHLMHFGIEISRVDLVGWAPATGEHLKLYERVDIALDTFPYNGTTTTCEALWMGVPVVTFPGSSHVSRVGAALLTHAGCTEWIAEDVEAYTTLAVKLSQNIDALAGARQGLRQRLKQSDLCDAGRLARALEDAFATATELRFPGTLRSPSGLS